MDNLQFKFCEEQAELRGKIDMCTRLKKLIRESAYCTKPDILELISREAAIVIAEMYDKQAIYNGIVTSSENNNLA